MSCALCVAACEEGGAPAPDSGPDAAIETDTTCPPTLVPHGSACIPVLDECPGNQVPVPGGGCKKIGVEECTVDGVPGIKGPPDWTCVAVGIPYCARGWKRVKDWCEPILPAARCPAGSMALIGHSTCQPMGDCGTGTWGALQTSSKTIFVDQSHVGPVFDGSQANPFASIGQALAKTALAKATQVAHVAVAAGTYNEDLVITTPVKLEGRCAQKVIVKGVDGKIVSPDNMAAAMRIVPGASGTVVRGLTVTGPAAGIWVEGEAKANIEDVALVRCGATALQVHTGAEVVARRCKVANNEMGGANAKGARLELFRSVVRDAAPWSESPDLTGYGVKGMGPYLGKEASLTLRDCVVSNNRYLGVGAFGAKATVERTVVQDTRGQVLDDQYGFGVGTADFGGQVGRLEMTDCLVRRNRTAGVYLYGGTVHLERVTVRDTKHQAADDRHGVGVLALESAGRPASVTLRHCLVDGNRDSGVKLGGADVFVEGSIVRNTLSQLSDGLYGSGLGAYGLNGVKTSLQVDGCLVHGNTASGVGVREGATVAVTRTVVRDTLPQQTDNLGGVGVSALSATLLMTDVLLDNNRHVGIGLWGATGTLERVVVQHTQPQLSDNGSGIAVVAEPGLEEASFSTLQMSDCLLARNRDGLHVVGSSATVERSVVRDVLGYASDGTAGVGIVVAGLDRQADLQLQDSQVLRARSAGVLALSAKATVQRCVFRQTLPDNASAGFGDGVEAGPMPSPEGGFGPRPSLTLEHSLVERSHRAGALFVETVGAVRGSVFRYGLLPVVLDGAETPEIGEDNVFEHNQDDRIGHGQGMAPVPPPVLPPPPKMPEMD